MNQELLDFYDTYKNKLGAYRYVGNEVSFAQATIAPKDGIPFQNQMRSILMGDMFSYMTDPENIAKIEKLYNTTDDALLKKEIGLRLKDLHQISKLPKDFYVDLQMTLAQANQAYEVAKPINDWESYKPHLLKVIEKRKESLKYFDYDCSDYDYLLDQFETGMNQEKYDEFFNLVKEKLVPLIAKIKEAQPIDDSLLFESFDVEKQKEFTSLLKESLKMDPKKVYLTESIHPFCSFFSTSEVRMTTKYLENNVMSAILSTAHEYGHGLYGIQINPAYQNTELQGSIGFGMHESQSRLVENYIAKNPGFWSVLYPKLQNLHPQLKNTSQDDFLKMVNVSKPGLIRIEADELTYPIHVLIRYELEKQIFNGTIDLENIDKIWADKYEEYLGIRPTVYNQGIMQDMHWSAAYFGYFPTYALGSAFASQFYSKLSKDINIDETLSNDQFEKIAQWLKDNIHQYGAEKDANQLLLDVTGEPFNPNYYTDYLIEKYTKLYNL